MIKTLNCFKSYPARAIGDSAEAEDLRREFDDVVCDLSGHYYFRASEERAEFILGQGAFFYLHFINILDNIKKTFRIDNASTNAKKQAMQMSIGEAKLYLF